MRYRIAQCHYRLGEYKSAVDVLQSMQIKGALYHSLLGRVYTQLGRYGDAETQFGLALQTDYGSLIQQNNNTDYYGRELKSSTANIPQKEAVNFLAQSPEDRLHAFRYTSRDIIADLCLLADVYSKSGKYSQAATYYKKAQQCVYEFYGDGAVVYEAGQMLDNLGINYRKSGEYYKADECFDQARAI